MKKNQQDKINQVISVVYTGEEWIPLAWCDFVEFSDPSDGKIVKFEYKGKKFKGVLRTILS
jgi:hypothetical protein